MVTDVPATDAPATGGAATEARPEDRPGSHHQAQRPPGPPGEQVDQPEPVRQAGTEDAAEPPPTVLIRMADAGDVYVSWRWTHALSASGVSRVPKAAADGALDALEAALPGAATPRLTAALTSGAFSTYDSELALAERLSRTFLPYGLAQQLHELWTRGVRPLLRIQPSPRTARLPWELLAPDPGLRLLDIADLGLLAPTSVTHAPGRAVSSWSATRRLPVVAVLDPRVPGFRADSALGSVLGRPSAQTPLARQIAGYAQNGRLRPDAGGDPAAMFRRSDVDREWLSVTLRAGASRLLYVGHVTAAAPESGQSENAQLHLACGADSVGFAPPIRAHRPLSAKDLLLGTHSLAQSPESGAARWPVPSRVALIACESGGDMRFGEALGLATAMVHGGAELVTTTRWALPTDLAFHRLAGAPSQARPLHDAVCAIDAAHEEHEAVRALNDWQRTRLDAWRTARTVEHSPVLWGAFATIGATLSGLG
ncbi:CHAT domain-containing protein [Streptomyces zagrosensis]|uniref:CHAT domain-containing protein n=1 Tax=Streptomyces zagrosensis TaxID=1042984 RepID=A0A7W9QDX2_9ACTN|nr:CHAT domain-containing protein [Streptomyces zagrosensis]MBB5937948.1 hypothetical protein [Streptomyces zagrosensis]